MTTQLYTPTIDVTVDGVTVGVVGGALTLDALGVPYATATVVLPLTPDTLLDDLDPRDDHRVIIDGGNSGYWGVGYGFGPYGHGPYGHGYGYSIGDE